MDEHLKATMFYAEVARIAGATFEIPIEHWDNNDYWTCMITAGTTSGWMPIAKNIVAEADSRTYELYGRMLKESIERDRANR